MPTSGERHLNTLLGTLSPVLVDEEFVFLTFADAAYGDHAMLQPVASCVETEGLTLVVPRQQAVDLGHAYDAVFSEISLQVHSSLEAIGLTAAISTALARQHISANVIAGFFHDHIFVPQSDSTNAMAVLVELAELSRSAE